MAYTEQKSNIENNNKKIDPTARAGQRYQTSPFGNAKQATREEGRYDLCSWSTVRAAG
jgi:hypothetical protein